MILASAQTRPKRGKIKANLEDHYQLINLASQQGADLIVFPEMSITGYEREKAKDMAFTPEDSKLNELRKLSIESKIIIIAGAPINIENELYIGAFILKPDDSILIYTKQYLHTGEEIAFKPSFDFNPIIKLGNEIISIAICADIDNPEHSENASKIGTTIYIASIFFTPNGISNAYTTLSDYATKYSMNILMSNYCGQSWGMDAGGLSGFWNNKGELIANLNATDSGLLLIEKKNDTFISKRIAYK